MRKNNTTEAHNRQRMLEYGRKHGGTKAALRYRYSRKTYYKWLKVWDGTWQSLKDRSRAPKTHPRKIDEETINKIRKRLKQFRWTDLLMAYQVSVEKDGYTASYGAFKRIASRLKGEKSKRKKKRTLKPYKRAEYPGQKVQIDVKFVPAMCVTNGKKYYQFTAVDECTRWTYREMYDEHSTFSAKCFLEDLIRKAPFPIREVQTDNGTEFTNALLVTKSKHKTMFEQALLEMGIEYHRIQIATPRHNGKVERQHRTDSERFYRTLRMYNLEDGRKQLAVYQRKSNDHIKTCLGLRSPNQVLQDYLGVM